MTSANLFRGLATATVITALASGCASTGGLPAGGPQPETAAFVVRLGVDTMGMERYTRTGNRIEGEGFVRQRGSRSARSSSI
jgi:hypothetical protein